MIRLLVNGFPFWAIGLSLAAFYFPSFFAGGKAAIVPLLSLVMFGMGMTLTWSHFKGAMDRRRAVAAAVAVQFLLMPFFAWLAAKILALPVELLAGMILVGCSAGGTASNVICYLARGDVALSILMTMTSTFLAVVLMPLLTYLYLRQSVPVPAWDMTLSILQIVAVPVIAGTALNTFYGHRLRRIEEFFPLISCLAVALIIAIIVGLNRQKLADLSLATAAAVILHNVLGLSAGYGIARLIGFDEKTSRTVCIEVGMQNSGLSVALAVKFFSAAAALPGALFSIWHNISGSILASYWRSREK
ncbi:MAG: bile acid:sodium symporter family protein [Gammaproteobacteria bacterium]